MTTKDLFAPIHPDDIMVFTEVAQAVRTVAKKYDLPLKSVEGLPNPEYRWSPTGDCSADGVIRLVFRGMTDGKWDPNPRREQDVWWTAAHELAHLRHFNHGVAFQEFELEMQEAIENLRGDHRSRIIKKLIKMQEQRQGEAQLGNTEAAENFASMINRMMLEHELNPTDLDFARTAANDPVIELRVDWKRHMKQGDNPKKYQSAKRRIAWQETLARVVANANLCSFLVSLYSDDITFVGTRAHATVAEYVYSMLVFAAHDMANAETNEYKRNLKRRGEPSSLVVGFKESWLSGFITRIDERLQAERKAAIKEVVDTIPGGESTALMRLNGPLMRVQQYIDDKFGGGSRYAKAIKGPRGGHSDGSRAGKAAADRMPIGKRGIERGVKGLLES